MKLRPLLITDEVRADIKRVTDHAFARVISTAQLVRRLGGGGKGPPGDDARHCCVVPIGYRCVFTVEEHVRTDDTGGAVACRHLSVSVLGEGDSPNPLAVDMLMEAFGFRGNHKTCLACWTEKLDVKNKIAVNVLEPIDEAALTPEEDRG